MAGKSLTTKIVFAGHDGVSRVLAGIVAGVGRAADQMSRAGERMQAIGHQMSLAISLPAAAALKVATDQAVRLEDASLELSKAVDLDGMPFTNLRNELAALGDQFGQTTAEVIGAAADAAKAGVPVSELQEFVRLSAAASSAWNLAQGETAEALAKIKTALSLDNGGMGDLIDAINFYADSSATDPQSLIDFQKRTAGSIQTLKIDPDFGLALGASLMSAGVKAENASTGINKMFAALAKGNAISKDSAKAFASLGIDPEKLRLDMDADPVRGVNQFLAAAAKLQGTARLNALREIVGDEADDEISQLVDRLDEFRASYEKVEKGLARGSALKEFQRAQQTLGFSLRRMSASWANLGAVIGSALGPDIKGIADAISTLNANLIKSPDLARAMGRALASAVVIGPGLIALGLMASGIATLMRLATVAVVPLLALGKAIRVLGLAFLVSGKMAAVARGSLLAVAMAGAPLVAVLGSIAAGLAVLWNAWPRLSATIRAFDFGPTLAAIKDSFVALFDADFNGALSGLKRAFASIKPLLANISRTIAAEWTAMLDRVASAVPSFGPLRQAFSGAVASVSEFVASIGDLLYGNAGAAMGKSLAFLGRAVADAGFAAATVVLDGFSGAVRTLSKAIRDFDAGGLSTMFAGLPDIAKFLGLAVGLRMIGPALTLMATSAGALRGFSLAGVLAGVGKVNPVTLFAVGWGLGEVGKQLGLLDSSFNSEAFAAGLASIPLAISAAQGVIAGGAAIARWTGIGRLAGLAYAAGVRGAVILGSIIAAAWQALSAVAAGLAGAVAGRAYIAGLALSSALGTAIATAWAGIGTASATTAGTAWGTAFGAAAALAIGAAVMAALNQFDPKGNLGGMTKPLDDGLRDLLNLPAKDTGITPGEIWTGLGNLFSGAPTIESPALPSNVIMLDDVRRARAMGIGGNTTDTLPGKAKDDLDIGLAAFRSQSLSEARRAADASVQAKAAIEQQTPAIVSAINALQVPLAAIPGAISSIKVMGLPTTSVKTEGATPAASLNSRGKMHPGHM